MMRTGSGTWLLAVVVATVVPAAAGAGPIQWNSGPGANGHWYEAVAAPGGITWDDAKAAAGAQGGYLATIASADENTFAFNLIDDSSFWFVNFNAYVGPWLGGYQQQGCAPEPSCGWTWVDGSTWGYTNWESTEPSNGVGSPYNSLDPTDALHYFRYQGRGSTWNDAPWDLAAFPSGLNPIAYIVEYSTDPAASTPVTEPASFVTLALGLLGPLAANRCRWRS